MAINRNLNLLYPPFREVLSAGLDEAHAQGIMAYVFEGFRGRYRQNQLYAQGRTTPGKIITFATPGLSWHEYGLAVDIVFDADPLTPGMQWTWEGGYADQNGDNYAKLAVILKNHGLEWLGDTNIERAHFQKTYGFSIQEAKRIADIGGVLSLWDMINQKTGG